MLNLVWISFFLIAFAAGLVQLVFFGDQEVFTRLAGASFEMSNFFQAVRFTQEDILHSLLGCRRQDITRVGLSLDSRPQEGAKTIRLVRKFIQD